MAENHVLLETIALSQNAASITFDNIPQTGYTDLVIKSSVRTTESADVSSLNISLNGSTSTFNQRYIVSNGGGVFTGTQARWVTYADGGTATANTFSNDEIYIANYTSSTTNKSFLSESTTEQNSSTAYLGLFAGIWGTTSAITSITLTPAGGSLAPFSTFSLYGVAAFGTTPVTAPFATGGNIVAQDGTYWYHAFLTSGNFVPLKALSCDALVVAGGGGGSSGGGGGGAGGLLALSSQSLTEATNYTVTVGAGGSGAFENKGTDGSNSQFGALTAAVGGGAGGTDYVSGLAAESGNLGGSGGGASMNPTASGIAGLGTAGQGNNGGVGSTSAPAYGGGGGGGAGAVGGSGNGTIGGNGGAGSSSYSSWGLATNTGHNVSGTYWFAGGGAGSTNTGGSGTPTGGNGGGGNGGFGTAQPGVAGLRNTGGGGGSSSGGAAGGTSAAAGSGIVIVRYPMSS